MTTTLLVVLTNLPYRWPSLSNMVYSVVIAELGRGEAGALLKDPAKMIQTGKAAQLADRGNAAAGVQQKLLCLLDPCIQNVLLWGFSAMGSKQLS